MARHCLQQRLDAARADRIPSEMQVRQRPILLERERQRPRARRPDAVVRQPQLLQGAAPPLPKQCLRQRRGTACRRHKHARARE